MSYNNVGIIPARLESERFPNKLLSEVLKVKIIQRVINHTKKLDFINHIVLASENKELKQFAIDNDIEFFLMKKGTARCGSERTHEYFKINKKFDYYISIPSDEPYLDHIEINKSFYNSLSYLDKNDIGTFYTKFYCVEDFLDYKSCKMIIDKNKKVLYFSREKIPSNKKGQYEYSHVFNKHLGIFVFSNSFLNLHGSDLWDDENTLYDSVESLEQNRFLEKGYVVRAIETMHIGNGIDSPEQVEKMENRLRMNNIV